MSNFKNTNDCCCTCGVKKGICIINQLIEAELITDEDVTAYYNENKFISNIKLNPTKYPNLIQIKDEGSQIIQPSDCLTETEEDIKLCLEFLNAIEINVDDAKVQPIINVLNKNYYHLLIIDTPCEENCCCKYSFIALFKDIYMEANSNDRKFKLGVCGICEDLPIIQSGSDEQPNPPESHELETITLDCDVGWFIYRTDVDAKIYLVPLCKIYGVIN